MRNVALSLFGSALMLLTISMDMRANSIRILSVTAASGEATALGGSGFLGESWSSSNTYANVNISAQVSSAPFSTDPIVSVTAYLTSQIGSGTTLGDQIATATVAVPGFSPDFGYTTLFSDLTLGPGNYFLTLAATDPTDSGTAAWAGYGPGRVATDIGVAWLGDYGVGGVANLSYPPASEFHFDPSFYGFEVTGEPVSSSGSEPSTSMPLALCLFVWALPALTRKCQSKRNKMRAALLSHKPLSYPWILLSWVSSKWVPQSW
jgi:hypothetical protein